MHLKLLQKTIQKVAVATGDLTGNKIAHKITKNSPQNKLEIEESIELPKYIYIYLQKKDSKLLAI